MKGRGNHSSNGKKGAEPENRGKRLWQEVYWGRLVCSDLLPMWLNMFEDNRCKAKAYILFIFSRDKGKCGCSCLSSLFRKVRVKGELWVEYHRE